MTAPVPKASAASPAVTAADAINAAADVIHGMTSVTGGAIPRRQHPPTGTDRQPRSECCAGCLCSSSRIDPPPGTQRPLDRVSDAAPVRTADACRAPLRYSLVCTSVCDGGRMDDNADELLDYCKRCTVEYGCNRIEVIYAPHTIYWAGPGKGIVVYYECEDGHVWTCWWTDRWLDANIA